MSASITRATTTARFYPPRHAHCRVTIVVSEPYKTLIDELAQLGVLRLSTNARGENVWVSQPAPFRYYDLAKRYPQWTDEIAHIVAASMFDSDLAIDTLRGLYNHPGTQPRDRVYSRLLNAYTRAPAELPACGVDMLRMARNFSRVFFFMQALLPDRESEFAPRVHALLRNPPAAFDDDLKYLHAHNLHMGLLVYCNYPTDPEHIRDALQRMGHAAHQFAVRYPRRATEDVKQFARLALTAPVTQPLLPIIHRLGDAHAEQWCFDFAHHFLQAFVGGRGAFDILSGDDLWVKNTLRPIVADALDTLMYARDFRRESVDAVFQTLVETIPPEDYAAYWVQPVLRKYTAHLLRNLVAAYANRVPEHAETIVRRTAEMARTPALIDKFSELVVGTTESDYDMMEKRMPGVVRETAKHELVRLYPRLRGRITTVRGTVAARLTMAFMRIRPTAVFDHSTDREKIARWETAINLIQDPQRLLRDSRNAAFARWLDHARREAIARDLCGH
jgi:hypothetical protein